MKSSLVTIALVGFLVMSSEAPAQMMGGGVFPMTYEPSEFCLFEALRVERTLGTATNFNVSTQTVFKSDLGGLRSASANGVDLYKDVAFPPTWSWPSTVGTQFTPTAEYEFQALLDLPAQPQMAVQAFDQQSLPGPHTLGPNDADLVQWSSGISYCYWSDSTTAHIIQTARFHGALGGLVELKFYIRDFNQAAWEHLKTVAIDGQQKQMVGIDFVELQVNWENDANLISALGFGEFGSELKVEAKFVVGEQVVIKEDIKELPLWWSGLLN